MSALARCRCGAPVAIAECMIEIAVVSLTLASFQSHGE